MATSLLTSLANLIRVKNVAKIVGQKLVINRFLYWSSKYLSPNNEVWRNLFIFGSLIIIKELDSTKLKVEMPSVSNNSNFEWLFVSKLNI